MARTLRRRAGRWWHRWRGWPCSGPSCPCGTGRPSAQALASRSGPWSFHRDRDLQRRRLLRPHAVSCPGGGVPGGPRRGGHCPAGISRWSTVPCSFRDRTACGAGPSTRSTSTIPARHLAHAGHGRDPVCPSRVVARQCVEEVDAVGRLGPPNPARHAPGRDREQRPPVPFFGARPLRRVNRRAAWRPEVVPGRCLVPTPRRQPGRPGQEHHAPAG